MTGFLVKGPSAMEMEESVILQYAVKKLNDEIRRGAVDGQDTEQVDRTLFVAVDEAVEMSDKLAPSVHEWFDREVEKGSSASSCCHCTRGLVRFPVKFAFWQNMVSRKQ
jgi:hypothetical protein